MTLDGAHRRRILRSANIDLVTQRRRHSYFAYGSNLCVRQMAQRCPDAGNPRRAVLTDHDWLINQRGVATVEPFDGTQVHGVVWDVSDHDLATLDSAEGVPSRYRRDQMTVQIDDGHLDAWVYIDHRVDPGPPRPGYLERIIDGALHHRLPQSWIDFLRRWDPSRWPRPRSRPTTPAPQSLSELLAEPGVVEVSQLRSRFGFLAIHGGGLEEMTDVIAERAADAAGASVYLIRHPDRYPHHLSSARFRAPNQRVSRSSSTTSTSQCRCTGTAESAAPLNCWPVGATARWPPTLPNISSCPATTSSPTWTTFRSSSAGSIRRTR